MINNNTIIILAPLQGFTDVTFRNVYSDHFAGVDEAMAPFISTMGQKRTKPTRIKDVDPETNKKLFITPQILGNEPDDFIFLANHLHDLGYKKINWNLGCPHSKIAKKKRGSGLLMYPDIIDAFLDRVLPKISNTLSVKIRLGRKSKDEIIELLPILDKYPLDEIILHPRTGEQMYTGISDHDAFAYAIANSRHSFTYNGDIINLCSFDTVCNKFPGIHRFMIGRGILANPFLAEQIKGFIIEKNKLIRLKNFHDALFENYQSIFSGPGHLISRMKGFWNYLGLSFNNSEKQIKNILKSKTTDKYQDQVNELFNADSEFTG